MDPHPEGRVSLTIPNRPEYVRVVRLALSGMASRLMFSYDDIEDIKLAVAEGCNTVMDLLGPPSDQAQVEIHCATQEEGLVIEIQGCSPEPLENFMTDETTDLSFLLMRSLMDEVHTSSTAVSPGLTLIKRPSR